MIDNSWSRRWLDDHIVSAQRGRGGALQIRDRLIVIRFSAYLGRARVDKLILKLKDQKSSREARPVPLLLARQLNLRALSRGPRRQNLSSCNLYSLRRGSHIEFNCLLQDTHLRQFIFALNAGARQIGFGGPVTYRDFDRQAESHCVEVEDIA